MKNTKLPGVGKISRLVVSGDHFNLEPDDRRYGDPVRACEICGEERPSSDMINIILVVGSPGHHSLTPFQHPEEEHWACSLDCWNRLAHRVTDEMLTILQGKHKEKGLL